MNNRIKVGSMLVAMWALGGPVMGQLHSSTLIILEGDTIVVLEEELFAGGDEIFMAHFGGHMPGIFLQDEEGDVIDSRRRGRRGGQRLALMKMWQIAEFLDLSDDQVDQLFPILRANQKEQDEQREKRRALHKAYSEKLEAGEVTKRDVDRFLDDLVNLDKARVDLRRKHMKNIAGALEQDKMAKFVVFDERFKQRLHRMVRPPWPPKAPGRRWAPKGPGKRWAPD